MIVSNIFQARFMGDMPSETISKIHLVDLAGRFVSLHISVLFLQVQVVNVPPTYSLSWFHFLVSELVQVALPVKGLKKERISTNPSLHWGLLFPLLVNKAFFLFLHRWQVLLGSSFTGMQNLRQEIIFYFQWLYQTSRIKIFNACKRIRHNLISHQQQQMLNRLNGGKFT